MTFKYLQSIEKKIRVQELVIILTKLFQRTQFPVINVRFLEYILSTILESGKKEHIDSVMECIKLLNIPSTLQMQQIYFQCFDKERHKIKRENIGASNIFEETKLTMESMNSTFFVKEEEKVPETEKSRRKREIKLIEAVIKSGKLRRRTF